MIVDKKKALKHLIRNIVGLLAAVMLVVYLVDPFYQYHAPFFGLPAVLYDRDHQVVGTIRSFEYDSVLLGSSVAENFNTDYLKEQYDCDTLKVIRASGSVADLLYYMDMVHEEQELKRVFWSLDIFALTSSTEVTLYGEEFPRYLHTKSILDDYSYLLNKDVLFMKIPLTFAYGAQGRNSNGQAYDWSADKDFSAAGAMRAYVKPEENLPMQSFEEEKPLIAENIRMVLEEINSHPQTEYTILFPPYSMLWWDSGYVNGISEKYFYVLEQVLPQLIACENVKVYFFMAEKDIVCNLDNYMDMIHYTPAINQFMLEQLDREKYLVDAENQDAVLQEMRQVYEEMIEEHIYKYYPQ